MTAKTLMIQGTGSHVGKSVLVTALCRLFHRRGLRVAPFKAQNMALNSFVTADGKEIGWAQAVQAEAAGLLPRAEFNPVLLKPTGEKKSQVIVLGKPVGTLSAAAYERRKATLWPVVQKSLDRLREEFDLVIIEGAGSPAEINLKKGDIANMRVARYVAAPVLLVSDIDRGGVFGSLLGTLQLLEPWERSAVKGLVINKFRGDEKILRPGLGMIEKKVRKPVLGVLPYFAIEYQDQEDSVGLEPSPLPSPRGRGGNDSAPKEKMRVAVVRTPRISNFTDFDSLRMEPCVQLHFVSNAEQLDSPDLIILPGSKNTMEDLRFLEESGMAQKIVAAAKKGTAILGICGGYQMLGKTIKDPRGVESSGGVVRGLGLLDTETIFYPKKSLHQVEFSSIDGEELLHGYEIHMGQTKKLDGLRPLFRIQKRSGESVREEEGAVSPEGNVMGTYIHGLLANDAFRHGLLKKIAIRKGVRLSSRHLLKNFNSLRAKNWDRLADWAEKHLNMKAIYKMVGANRSC